MKTDAKETRADIFSTVAANTMALLKQTSGSDINDWTWDKIHTLKHNHPLG